MRQVVLSIFVVLLVGYSDSARLNTRDKLCRKLIDKMEDCLLLGYIPKIFRSCETRGGPTKKFVRQTCKKWELKLAGHCPEFECSDIVMVTTQSTPTTSLIGTTELTTEVVTVNGGWGEFGDWSECSAECGGGTHTKARACDNPVPANGGADCEGGRTETQGCNTDPCPVVGPCWLCGYRICFEETEGSSQCQRSRSSCSGWSSSPRWTAPFRDDTDDRGGGCRYKWKLESFNPEANNEYRLCFQETEGSSQCQGTRASCTGWTHAQSWTRPFRDDTDDRGGGCEYSWRIEQRASSIIDAAPLCRVCFKETEGSSQCQATRSTCSGWSDAPGWSAPFRDDTDDRGGGCRYQWFLDCIPDSTMKQHCNNNHPCA